VGRQRAEARLAELQLQNNQWADRSAQAQAELESIAEQMAESGGGETGMAEL